QPRETSSGVPWREVYSPATLSITDGSLPGQFPFTRGIQASMYRGKLWTMRQYAGFGSAVDANARFKYLLSNGQTGLSVAFDLPTKMGRVWNPPRASGEVGKVGVAIATLRDMKKLLSGTPLV